MIQLTVISVGNLKEEYYQRATEEYEKRLSAFCRVQNVSLKEEPIRNEQDAAEISLALKKEGEKILEKIPDGAFTVALCVEGEELSSPALASRLASAADRTGKLCFIIGSSHGLAESVKNAAAMRLSVSRLTFPHRMMRVILLEAVYRSFAIAANRPYHK